MALNFKCLSSTINLYHAGYFCVYDVVHYLTNVLTFLERRGLLGFFSWKNWVGDSLALKLECMGENQKFPKSLTLERQI